MGGGVAVLVMTALVDGLALLVGPFQAWRWALFVPGGLQVLAGVAVLLASDDSPRELAGGAGGASGGGGGALRRCAPRAVWSEGRGWWVAGSQSRPPGDTHARRPTRCPSPPARACSSGGGGNITGGYAGLQQPAACTSCTAPRPACRVWVPAAALNYRTYVMALAYALSFGVELTVDNIITAYFFDQFDLGLSAAGLVASVYGLMNLFTRAGGGWASDAAARRAGMRGRLWVLFAVLLLGGVTCALVGVAYTTLAGSIGALVVFSVFTQAACGCVFGVVPFLSHRSPGFAMGAVAAGGNAGSAVMQVRRGRWRRGVRTARGVEWARVGGRATLHERNYAPTDRAPPCPPGRVLHILWVCHPRGLLLDGHLRCRPLLLPPARPLSPVVSARSRR
jgi:hypothetical protein